jgi:proline dehydrogenase
MSILRTVLLRAAQSSRLRDAAPRYPFVRRAVARFMPGERLDDALAAARNLGDEGISTIVTRLGENITSLDEAEATFQHYVEALDRIRASGLDVQVSLKPTQLGLDQSAEVCFDYMKRILERAGGRGDRVWIDMEGSAYTSATLDLFRGLRAIHANVGVCLQAYLRRTAADLESLLPLGPAIRLVKGAYSEPPSIAFVRKSEVDRNYSALVRRLLSAGAGRPGAMTGVATHDPRIIEEVEAIVSAEGIPRSSYEFEMLYGIQRGEQLRLARAKQPIRVLISYGDYWFPWFMRRLAERPANVMFIVKNLFS